MDHVALDRPGPDDRHLDDEVVELARPEARQHGHLRPALDLEDAEGIGAAEHVVDGRVLVLDRGQRRRPAVVLPHEVEGAADAGEHAEGEDVDLEHADRVEVVLVPFDVGAVLHRRVHDRHHLVEPVAGHDEAADMLGEMAGEADQLLREERHLAHRLLVRIETDAADVGLAHAFRRPAPDGAGERADGVVGEAEDFADLAHRRAGAVGDDGGGDAGPLAAVFPVDVLHHLLAPLVLEIDVDVGRLVPLGRDEALEEELGGVGVHLGDAEAVADGGVGGGAAPLAEDALLRGRSGRCRGR